MIWKWAEKPYLSWQNVLEMTAADFPERKHSPLIRSGLMAKTLRETQEEETKKRRVRGSSIAVDAKQIKPASAGKIARFQEYAKFEHFKSTQEQIVSAGNWSSECRARLNRSSDEHIRSFLYAAPLDCS